MEMSGQLHATAALLPGKEPPGTHWIIVWYQDNALYVPAVRFVLYQTSPPWRGT